MTTNRGSGNHATGRLLTCAEAADLLGLKEATIRVWVSRRKMTCVKLSRAVRIPIEAVEELIRLGTIPARASR